MTAPPRLLPTATNQIELIMAKGQESLLGEKEYNLHKEGPYRVIQFAEEAFKSTSSDGNEWWK